MFSFFKKPSQEDKDYITFVKKMKIMARVYPILQSNPFDSNYSTKEQSEANDKHYEIKEWWVNNRDELSKHSWMSEKTYHDTNQAFGL